MDRFVIIRDNMAGVFVGTLIAHSAKSWALASSRKIHYWTKAAAVEGIASFGPGPGSRVCPLRVPPVGAQRLTSGPRSTGGPASTRRGWSGLPRSPQVPAPSTCPPMAVTVAPQRGRHPFLNQHRARRSYWAGAKYGRS